MRVSRLMLERKLGRPILPGMKALHTCDNPPCCNPAHIYEGTEKQNRADAIARRRAPLSESHQQCRLSSAEVAMIRSSSDGVCSLARQLGVSHSLVSLIRSGKRRRYEPT